MHVKETQVIDKHQFSLDCSTDFKKVAQGDAFIINHSNARDSLIKFQ
jgi:hypothetical protein